MWFVDKLGPAPGAVPGQPPVRASTGAKTQQAAPRAQAAPAQAKPPEPEKKKKGWF